MARSIRSVAPGVRRGYMLMASLASALMSTKRCQLERSPAVSAFSLRRKVFLNLRISLTFMLAMRGSVAAVEASVSRTFSNSSALGGRMEARLLTSAGSSRSRTERCCTARTLSMPSRLRPRLRLRKFEMWACLNPVCWARWKPVSSPASMRSHRILRRLSCKILNFMERSIAPRYGHGARAKRFPQGKFGHSTLTEKIHSYRIDCVIDRRDRRTNHGRIRYRHLDRSCSHIGRQSIDLGGADVSDVGRFSTNTHVDAVQ